MALQIKDQYGVTELYGFLNAQNMKSLQHHINGSKKDKEVLILSLDRIHGLDHTAARQLELMYRRTALNDRVLAIVGKENKNITEVMKATKTDYILSDDRA
ncbi:MAG: STAS domain-containing protein [Bacteroidota bacterium]